MLQEQGEASEQLQARVAALETENARQAEEIARLLKKVGGVAPVEPTSINQHPSTPPSKNKNHNIKKKIRDLEEENDLLALDNELLREKVNNAGAVADEEEAPVEAAEAPATAAAAATTSALFGSAMARLGGWVLIKVD